MCTATGFGQGRLEANLNLFRELGFFYFSFNEPGRLAGFVAVLVAEFHEEVAEPVFALAVGAVTPEGVGIGGFDQGTLPGRE